MKAIRFKFKIGDEVRIVKTNYVHPRVISGIRIVRNQPRYYFLGVIGLYSEKQLYKA